MNPGQRVGDHGIFSSSRDSVSGNAASATYWLVKLTALMCGFKTAS